jgi:hypothetical protein
MQSGIVVAKRLRWPAAAILTSALLFTVPKIAQATADPSGQWAEADDRTGPRRLGGCL